jgi:hypothetical protein
MISLPLKRYGYDLPVAESGGFDILGRLFEMLLCKRPSGFVNCFADWR